MNDDPEQRVRATRERLDALVGDLRRDVGHTDDPRFKALFETSAEVLIGLVKAFSDYERNNEAAWRKLSRSIWP